MKRENRELDQRDLMIGDWVMLEYEDSDGVKQEGPVKICRLAPNNSQCLFVTARGIVRNNYGAGILPIPITPEILVKNGFEKSPGATPARTVYICKMGKKLEERFHVNIFNEGYVETVLRTGRTKNLAFFNTPHVHELQHAIRLAGIEKEIEL